MTNTKPQSFEELVDAGVYEFNGWDEKDEMTFSLVPEVALRVCPEIYWKYHNEMQQKMLVAIDEGMMEWDFDPETLEESIVFTEKGMSLFECPTRQ